MKTQGWFWIAGVAALMSGCMVVPAQPDYVGPGVAVVGSVPPPRVEVIPVASGADYLWVPGYWGWERNRHHWVGGYWQHQRPGYRGAAPGWQGRAPGSGRYGQGGGRWGRN